MNKLDYIQWCTRRLTSGQYLVYSVLLEIGVNEKPINREKIAAICGLSVGVLRSYTLMLERLGFICLENCAYRGIKITWLRQSPEDKQPGVTPKITHIKSIKLRSPEGKIFNLKHGEITFFCKQHNLAYTCIWKLTKGLQKKHKGWKLEVN